MTVEELLLELQDIAPPPEPAWWLLPPAYLVVIGSIITVAVLAWFILRYRTVNRLVTRVDQDLQRIRSAYHDGIRRLRCQVHSLRVDR